MTAGHPRPLRVIGLTGGIASGKSTVSRMLVELGAPLVDADVLAREVVAPGTGGLAEVAARFPGAVVDGKLDRATLGRRVFSDPAERSALNAIVHPRIRAAFEARARALAERGERLVVYDAALLFENRMEDETDGVILVCVPEEVQRARLVARDGLSTEEAQARIDAQLPLADKARRARWIVDNSGPLEETRSQVERLWNDLRAL